MNNPAAPASNMPATNPAAKNIIPVTGFMLMLAGPIILCVPSFLAESLGYFPKAMATIIAYTAMGLPGIGAILGIISLLRWKKTGKLGRALALVTVIMCNPFFYYCYFLICSIANISLAGLSWM